MKLVYGITGVVAAIAAVVVGVLGMPDVMIVSLILAMALLVAANSDRIARFKAGMGGIEAETRAVIDEARATIEQLRQVGKIAVQASLSLVMRSGRLGGFSDDEKEEIRRNSEAVLNEIGVTASEREDIFRDWHRVTCFDYTHFLLGRNQTPNELQEKPALQAEWDALRRGGFANVPNADAVAAFLTKAGMINAARAELLEDYRFYEREKRHRRPEVWKVLFERK